MGKRDQWHHLYSLLEAAGFTLRQSRSGHMGVYNSQGARVYTMPWSASDRRSYLNAVSDLRRILGVTIPRPKEGRK